MFNKKNILLIVIVLVVLNLLFWLIFSGRLFTLKKQILNQTPDWYAVHLTNGQVYFGQIKSVNAETIVMKEVYFLEPSPDQQGVFNLIKRSTRDTTMLTDDIFFINRQVVLFWEKLTPEAEVVKSILRARGQ
ncbi:MAG: hypothetical protein N2259_00235 [Patescibacteria group bacterium]|nr:hypothetical protein [Patescibacteria group bacterium]